MPRVGPLDGWSAMQLRISVQDGAPIYQQIVEQVKYLVAAGRLKPGDDVPPIRVLAEQLRINPNTVARAYLELEREGIVTMRQGFGTTVAAGEDAPAPAGKAPAPGRTGRRVADQRAAPERGIGRGHHPPARAGRRHATGIIQMKFPSPSSAEAVIAVSGLSRHFGSKAALDDVSVFVPRGSVLGLVGENGAGKTTLIKHLLGSLKAQAGSVRVFGLDPVAGSGGRAGPGGLFVGAARPARLDAGGRVHALYPGLLSGVG